MNIFDFVFNIEFSKDLENKELGFYRLNLKPLEKKGTRYLCLNVDENKLLHVHMNYFKQRFLDNGLTKINVGLTYKHRKERKENEARNKK